MAIIDQKITDNYSVYNADCMEVLPALPEKSVGLSVYSPPFPELYQYSDDVRDMTNCVNYQESLDQYRYVVEQVARVTKPGRQTCVHCTDLRHGSMYQRDFPGDIIRIHEEMGLRYFCRVTIWKDPWEFARRTRMKSLMHKTVSIVDSSESRIAPADYLLVFKKAGKNQEPIKHEKGFKHYAGGNEVPPDLIRDFANFKGKPIENLLSHWIWRQYASPVWMDIRRNRLMPYNEAQENPEEKHVCLARDSRVLIQGKGYIPIQEVAVGDMALTHNGRWRKVLVVANTGERPVITVTSQGVPGLTLTPEHKLWMRKSDWVRERDGAEHVEPQWIEAESSLGGYVNFKLPDSDDSKCSLEDRMLWIVGRWLADGFFDARGYPHIACGNAKLDSVKEMLGDKCGFVRSKESASQVCILDSDGQLRDILSRCGYGAGGKHLPPEAFEFNAHQSKCLLDGYLAGDGHYIESRQRWTASSISRDLLLGLAVLAQRAYGAIASVYAGRPERDAIVLGREVRCQQDWIMSFDVPHEDRRSRPFILDDGAWKKVRSIEDSGTAETWCLRVEEDESFTAEGCVVKNCPLQLDVIERCVTLWSNPGDVVLTPFMGVGSEVFQAVSMGRKGIGVELKETYYRQAVKNAKLAQQEASNLDGSLFIHDEPVEFEEDEEIPD